MIQWKEQKNTYTYNKHTKNNKQNKQTKEQKNETSVAPKFNVFASQASFTLKWKRKNENENKHWKQLFLFIYQQIQLIQQSRVVQSTLFKIKNNNDTSMNANFF